MLGRHRPIPSALRETAFAVRAAALSAPMIPANKRPVEIEDLLRLKRVERPPAEFWNEFDRALRAKQLAALVGRRPWWQTLPRVLAGWRRAGIPIGATAVAALTFYSWHHSGS